MTLLNKLLFNKEYRLYSLIYLIASIICLIDYQFYNVSIGVTCIAIANLALITISIKTQNKIKPWLFILISLYFLGDYFMFMSILKMDKLYLSASIIASSIWGLFLLVYIYRNSRKEYSTMSVIIFLLFLICTGIIFAMITQNSERFFILGFITTLINVACCSISFTSILKKNTSKMSLLFILSALLLIGNTLFGLSKFQNIYIFGLLHFIIYYFVEHLI